MTCHLRDLGGTVGAVALALLALGPFAVSTAQAQSWTILPVDRDARVPVADRQDAGQAVADAPALGPSARLLPHADVVAQLPEGASHVAACLEVDCAAALARAANLDFVAIVAVWPAEQDPAALDVRPGTVAVTLVDPDGTIHEADSAVEGDLLQATTSAFVSATRARGLGRGTELRIDSEPQGALVILDGVEIGATPYTGAHPPGAHELELRLRGHVERRVLNVGDHPMEVHVPLGEPILEQPDSPSASRGTDLRWWIGGAFILAGVATLISPAVTLARHGDVVEEDASGVERVHFGTRSAILTGIGAAAIGAGVLYPILSADGDSAAIAYRTSF